MLTVVGSDRPGLVDRLTGILAERGFNLEDSRMAVLGGEFAGILLISGDSPQSDLKQLASMLESETGMTVTIRETTAPGGGRPSIPFVVRGYAMDHPGIVHGLAHEIASLGANIDEMETSMQPAPVTGTPLFDVKMRVSLPAEVSVSDLRQRLAKAGEKNNIDITVEPFVS